MKRIKQSDNPHRWPRCETKSIECRKRDLVVRIADWSRDKDEPAFDVEVYIGGVYDFNESESFTFSKVHGKYPNKQAAKTAAASYAATQITKLL